MDSREDPRRCAFFFDVERPKLGAEYPTPVRDFNEFAAALGYQEPERALSKDQRLVLKMDFCAFELLRRWANGREIPVDGEMGHRAAFPRAPRRD
jgi:hypothetical protein